jgi:hypothetical protein
MDEADVQANSKARWKPPLQSIDCSQFKQVLHEGKDRAIELLVLWVGGFERPIARSTG